jgi:DNA-binding NtrC family response regulator
MEGLPMIGLANCSGCMFSAADKGRTHVAELFEALIISSEQEDGRILAARLGEHGITPSYCSPLDAEQIVLSRESVRLVFCDSRLIKQVYPGLRRAIHLRQSRVLPVILKHPGETETSLQVRGLENVEIIAPPFEGAAIERIIQKAIVMTPSVSSGDSPEERN